MAYGINLWFTASLILFVLNFPILVGGTFLGPKQQVPCYFVFGDSLFDNGNNNVLNTTAKVNYPPYGIDFPGGPTGRFTNGRNIADMIAELLGFPNYIPPFATATSPSLLRGVNYASGGAGIRVETGRHLGQVINLGAQLINHKSTIARIAEIHGDQNFTNRYLRKCIYSVGIGSNDYINNYLMPKYYNSSRRYTPTQYAGALLRQYYKNLRLLYWQGARKVVLFGLGRIGCIPVELAKIGATNGSFCADMVNSAVILFNDGFKSLVDELNHDFPDAKFTFINITSISVGTMDPSAAVAKFQNFSAVAADAFKAIMTPCCKVSAEHADQCIPNENPCSNRNLHPFFDSFHPSEIAILTLAARSYNSLSPTDAYPIDIRTLALL